MADSLSIVVTAPHGIADCLYLEEIRNASRHLKTQIIVVDAADKFKDQSTDNLLHLHYRQRGIQGLIREGVLASSGDWILITEDHCQPDAKLVSAYWKMMQENPDIDLFSGTVKNATSTSAWSTATYLIGLAAFSPYSNSAPKDASNANMLIRRAAIDPIELQHDGGLLNLTLPRIIDSARHMHNSCAVVDHIVPLKPSETVGFIAHCTLDALHENRKLKARRNSAFRSILESIARFVAHLWFVPRRIIRLFRGTGHLSTRLFLCVTIVSAGLAFVALGADLKRVLGRS